MGCVRLVDGKRRWRVDATFHQSLYRRSKAQRPVETRPSTAITVIWPYLHDIQDTAFAALSGVRAVFRHEARHRFHWYDN